MVVLLLTISEGRQYDPLPVMRYQIIEPPRPKAVYIAIFEQLKMFWS